MFSILTVVSIKQRISELTRMNMRACLSEKILTSGLNMRIVILNK